MSVAIEQKILERLAGDATLVTLLGGTADDKKIYPVRNVAGTAAPYIVYSLASESGEENINDARVQVKIVVDNYDYATANSIRDRVNALLDIQDAIQNYCTGVLWCQKNGGGDLEDADTEQIAKVIIFDVKYHK